MRCERFQNLRPEQTEILEWKIKYDSQLKQTFVHKKNYSFTGARPSRVLKRLSLIRNVLLSTHLFSHRGSLAIHRRRVNIIFNADSPIKI